MRVGPAAIALVAAIGGLALTPTAGFGKACSSYRNQAAAQRAADTRDADHDGIYCESLPCPCSKAKKKAKRKKRSSSVRSRARQACTKPADVQTVVFSAAKYPNIRKHYMRAVSKGWPRILKVHRRKTGVRRDRALEGFPTRKGYDRDEYPPAIGRATWRADVAYVPSHENRSHGSSLGGQLRGFCAGTRFRYAFD